MGCHNQSMETLLLKAKLLGTSLLFGLAFAGTAFAQDQDPVVSELGDVVVTGSRIRLQDYVAANPVTSVTAESIALSGNTNLTNFLTETPALANSLTLQDGADTSTPSLAGLNLLDLRSLGTDRTLVLVNGRRHVGSSPGTAAVDVNSIPSSLIERVEVLTGGASAVYGADGVSGVVNFILKKDFEGVAFNAQTGVADAGGAENYFGSFLIGNNFHEGRGNVTFGVEYNKDNRLTFNERSYTRSGERQGFFSNPADPGTFDSSEDDPDILDLILTRNVRYIDTSLGGSVYTDLFNSPNTSGVTFLGDGSDFIDGEYLGGAFMIGGSGSPTDDFNDDLLPGLERGTVSFTGRYEISPKLRFFTELKYTNSKTQFAAQPSYVYGLFIDDDNPFIPANVLAAAQAPGTGLATDEGRELHCDLANICLPENGVLLARDNFDLGRQNYDVERETWRGVIGIEGDLTDNISYELSYTYGRADQKLTAKNVLINDRFFAATDVVTSGGSPVCRSDLDPSAVPYGDIFGQFAFPANAFGATFTPGANSGCQPLNLFGEDQNSAEAIAWVMGEYTSDATIDQEVINGFVSGDTTGFFSLPAGPIGFVVGFEYRKESSDSRPADIELLADSLEYPLTGLGRASRTKGSFDVTEGFAEVSVPLLRDLPFAKLVNVSAAYRYSDYSTSGGADTWNLNGRWAVDDTLAFRATKARAVRAPNIVDLFQGRQQTFGAFADPCSQENLSSGENPTLRKQNCATDLTALGVDPGGFINSSSESVGGFVQGNPDLKPETADTYTLGFVLTPADVPGLSFSLDYYNIKIEDAIQAYSSQTIVNNCYDLPRPNSFCDLIERGTVGGNAGRITSFSQVPGNLATYETSGYDMTARYLLDLNRFSPVRDLGTINFVVVGNLLDTLSFTEVSGATPVNSQGRLGAPDYTATFDATWRWQKVAVNYGFSYFSETNRYSRITRANDPDIIAAQYKKYPAREVHDLQLRYAFNDGIEVYGGVNNFTDQKPAAGSESYPVNALGRYFYVGLNAKLDSLGSMLSGW